MSGHRTFPLSFVPWSLTKIRTKRYCGRKKSSVERMQSYLSSSMLTSFVSFVAVVAFKGASSAKRDDCRKLIALLQTINTQAANRMDYPRSLKQQATNTLFRMINIVFSSEFLERFKELNDAKQRVDYETRNLQQKLSA
jgi:hypothetical protein